MHTYIDTHRSNPELTPRRYLFQVLPRTMHLSAPRRAATAPVLSLYIYLFIHICIVIYIFVCVYICMYVYIDIDVVPVFVSGTPSRSAPLRAPTRGDLARPRSPRHAPTCCRPPLSLPTPHAPPPEDARCAYLCGYVWICVDIIYGCVCAICIYTI